MDTTPLPATQHPAAPAEDNRKPYECPEITSFGDVTEVTGETSFSADY